MSVPYLVIPDDVILQQGYAIQLFSPVSNSYQTVAHGLDLKQFNEAWMVWNKFIPEGSKMRGILVEYSTSLRKESYR